MSTIRMIYDKDPGFPATDQHPDAVRFIVGGKVVDAIGGQPTQAEVDAMLNPPKVSNAAGFVERQRAQSLNDLDAAIAAVPVAQQPALRLIHQLLKKD